MADPMGDLDPHLQAPARLKLATTLTAVSEAEFAVLRERLEVSDSVLSKHLSALGEAGYVKVRKGSHQGRRTTWVSLSPRGRRAVTAHVAVLRELIADVP
jgi:DNA-binding MarR family transcriptional regulator